MKERERERVGDLQDRLIGSRYLGRYDNDDMSMKYEIMIGKVWN